MVVCDIKDTSGTKFAIEFQINIFLERTPTDRRPDIGQIPSSLVLLGQTSASESVCLAIVRPSTILNWPDTSTYILSLSSESGGIIYLRWPCQTNAWLRPSQLWGARRLEGGINLQPNTFVGLSMLLKTKRRGLNTVPLSINKMETHLMELRRSWQHRHQWGCFSSHSELTKHLPFEGTRS